MKHLNYAVLAACIAISDHEETNKTFSRVVGDLYTYGAQRPLSLIPSFAVNLKNGCLLGMISKEVFEIIQEKRRSTRFRHYL